MTAERLLVLLLRLSAIILWCAIPAIFFPFSWMDAGHRWLGLGPLPELPLIHYLNRSVAALYASLGVFTWLISRDVRHHRLMVLFWAWMHIIYGAFLIGIDVHAGMPWFWTIAEGPGLIVAGIIVLILLRKIPDSASRPSSLGTNPPFDSGV